MKLLNQFYTLLFLLFAVNSVQAQTAPDAKTVHETDKKTDLLLDSAARHMVNFILTKNEAEYDNAMTIIKQAEASNIKLDSLGKASHGALANEVNQDVASNIEEINTYFDASVKQKVLADKGTTEKIKFKGKLYTVGKPSKDLYYKFIAFLPAN